MHMLMCALLVISLYYFIKIEKCVSAVEFLLYFVLERIEQVLVAQLAIKIWFYKKLLFIQSRNKCAFFC